MDSHHSGVLIVYTSLVNEILMEIIYIPLLYISPIDIHIMNMTIIRPEVMLYLEAILYRYQDEVRIETYRLGNIIYRL
jgi:hypothetical protein